jgi:hypothetical protein
LTIRAEMERFGVLVESGAPIAYEGERGVTDGNKSVTITASVGGFASGAGMRGARQHAVFGGHPAEALTFHPARRLFIDGCRAQHAGIAELHQHRTFGMHGETTRKTHGPHFVGRAAAGAIAHGAKSGCG